MNTCTPSVVPTPEPIVQLDRLGDEIAELSAHLDAASARLLEPRLSLVRGVAHLACRTRAGCRSGARPRGTRPWFAAAAGPRARPR